MIATRCIATSVNGIASSTQTKLGTTTTYSYDAADELGSTTTGGVATTFGYDYDGNEIVSGSRAFTYDLAGRVAAIADGASTTAAFSYDGLGNRLTKTAGAATRSYLWDENNDLPQLALERNGST